MPEESNNNGNQSQNENGSSNQQNNPPLRDTNTYLEKGEKPGTTRKE